MTLKRERLKGYFKKGAIPAESHFAELIESMLVQEDDQIDKPLDGPLSIKSVEIGADETLLNFHRVDQGVKKLTWQLKQKTGEKLGLSISDGTANRLFIDSKSGNVGVGTNEPRQTLDVRGRIHVENGVIQRGGDKPITETSDLGLYSQVDKNWIRIVSTNAPIRFYTDGGIGTNMSLSVQSDSVEVHGNLTVTGNIQSRRNPFQHRMYPDNPLVYQDIFEAKKAGAIAKIGNAPYDDTTYTSKTMWNNRPIIKFGGDNDSDGNGAEVTIPNGYDTVWIRVLGERWTLVKAYFTDGQQESLGHWAGGWRANNGYSPDGSLADSYQVAHQWLPIPAGRSGKLALISKSGTNGHFWLSGLAFSRNAWSHAAQSAVAFHWASNGGNATEWGENWHAWNNDVLSKIAQNTNHELMVPVVPSGRDKLLYLVEHNNNWNGAMHNGIMVNGQPIERLMATYDNPFARHWNSKWYERYLAARIPAALIPADKRFLSVRINMQKQDQGIHFREIGTHDLDVPMA